MPKLKPSPIAAASEVVMRNIRAQGEINGCTTDAEKAKKIGMPLSTFSDRKRNPSSWQFDEIVQASIAFKCSLQWLVTDHRGEEIQ